MVNPENAGRDDVTAPDISHYLRTEASGPAATESAAGRPARPALQDVHKALVERIADVDDDRRRGAAALLKAFNAHRTQVQARLQHQQLLLGIALGVPLLLLAAALAGFAWSNHQAARQQDTRLAALEAGLAAVRATPAGPVGDPAPALTGQVAELQALTTRLAEEIEATAAAALTPEQVSTQLRGQLAPLLERLATLEAGLGEVQGRLAAAPAPAAATPAATLDRLIEQQLARLEREYERLAREVATPGPSTDAAGQAPPAPVASGEPTAVPAAPADDTPPAAGPSEPDPAQSEPAEPAPAEAAESPPEAVAPVPGPAAAPEPAAGLGSEPAPEPSGASVAPTIRVGTRGYALQLIGFHDPTALQEFIGKHTLPAQVYTREEQFRGRPWYVLIHSLHPDLASAGAAQAGLPPDLAGLDVWIRALPADAELQVIDTGR